MQIPKDQILDLLRQQGKGDQVGEADQQLPDQVDTEQHAGLLEKFGRTRPISSASSAAAGLGEKLGL